MSKPLKITLLLLAILSIFVFYTLNTTGFFRKVENKLKGEIYAKINIPGPEDIAISYTDSFLIVSSFDRALARDNIVNNVSDPVQGGLYYIDLRDQNFEAKLLTGGFDLPFAPHGISIYKLDSAHYQVYAISHANGNHTIEHFELFGDSLVYVSTIQDKALISPNDIVAIGDGRFYFTNDKQFTSTIGKLAEEYLGLSVTNVVYFDGNSYQEVDDGIAYANGINWDSENQRLYVAAPRAFSINVYQINADGSLNFTEEIDCGTGVDNIEFDQDGNIWIGCHPDLLAFAAYAAGKKPIAPSELIKIDYRSKSDYDVESVFVDTGENISASTVAAVFGSFVFIGNVMDEHVLVLRQD